MNTAIQSGQKRLGGRFICRFCKKITGLDEETIIALQNGQEAHSAS